jgi:hypothetical protein
MTELTTHQHIHLLLGDIAMSMAIITYDQDYRLQADAATYIPGSIRDGWLEQVNNEPLRRQVCALANAGFASLQTLDGAALTGKAERFGIPITAKLAGEIAEHFVNKREAVLTYNR